VGSGQLFIYTSGVWVYGSSPDEKIEDDATAPPALVARRLEVEARVLRGGGNNLVTAIVRPGCVYGGAGGLTANWFERARAWGAARVIGPAENRWAMVHRADLAYLYRRLVETHLGGIWNAVDASRDPVGACAEAAGRAVGHDGSIEVVPVDIARQELGDYADCLALDQQISSHKARTQLGWAPRHAGFVGEARQLAAAWRAHRR
jgi:nucleoside-diphosphate-sugar epimerase